MKVMINTKTDNAEMKPTNNFSFTATPKAVLFIGRTSAIHPEDTNHAHATRPSIYALQNYPSVSSKTWNRK